MDILSVFHILLTCRTGMSKKTSVEYLLDIRKMSWGSLWVLHLDSGDTLCLLLLIRIPKVVWVRQLHP